MRIWINHNKVQKICSYPKVSISCDQTNKNIFASDVHSLHTHYDVHSQARHAKAEESRLPRPTPPTTRVKCPTAHTIF